MTISIAGIENAFFAWASGAAAGTAITNVIFQNPSEATRPALPYATLHLMALPNRLVPYDERRPTGMPGTHEISGERAFSVSVNVYGPGARQLASDLADSLELESNVEAMRAAGLAIIEVTATNDLTEYLETRFEERAQFDVLARGVATQTDAPGYINSVTFGTNTTTT